MSTAKRSSIWRVCLNFIVALLILAGPFVPVSQASAPAQTEPGVTHIQITDNGFVPADVTIITGDEVIFENATNHPITLSSGPITQVYLPMLGKPAATTTTPGASLAGNPGISRSVAAVSSHVDPAAPASPDFFTATLNPGTSFSHIYTSIGDMPILATLSPFASILIKILRGGDIHGFIQMDPESIGLSSSLAGIYLPDIEVYARKISTGTESTRIKTDLHGRFVIPYPLRGTHQICWVGVGWNSGCTSTLYTIDSKTTYLIPLNITSKRFTVTGKVLQQDGIACRVVEPMFNTDVHTTVAVLNPQTLLPVVPAVRANVYGDYVIPEVPQGVHLLRATCENSVVDQQITIGTAPATVANLTLPNSSPHILSGVAFQGGQGVRLVPANTSVDVALTRSDPDGDALHYKWYSDTPGFTSVDSPNINWLLPAAPALHKLYAQVRDNQGGYHVFTIGVSTGPGILFAGTVQGNDGPLLANAAVTINGLSTTTNGVGWFSLLLPAESDRYVVTIEKQAFALFSKIYYEGIANGHFVLHRANHTVIDPTERVELIDRDRQGRTISVISIPAGSLVDLMGNLPVGMLDAYRLPVDLEDPNNSFPGDDYAGSNAVGAEVGIVSYGAIDIQIMDGAGQHYNLKPGAKATVSVLVDTGQLPGAPAAIPLWFYDKSTGIWREEGTATFGGGFYTTEVSHFSTLNMDVEFGNAACMRLLVDAARLTLPIELRVTADTGTGQDKIKTTTLNDQLSVILRLLPNTNVKLEVLDSLGNPIALATQNVSSGPGIGSAPTELPYPYEACQSEATLTIGLPEDPPFDPPAGEYHFLIREGIDDADSAAAYYAAADPTNIKTTFNDWKSANSMAVNPDSNGDGNLYNDDAATGEFSAAYENAGDLGFGRGMHGKQVGSNIAYYVCNYPTVDEARLNINLIACVAMEYSPLPGGSTRFIKFYVFDADGDRLLSADLDGRGQKFVPGLCMACHGGSYNPGEFVDAGGGLPSRNRFRVSPAGNPNQGSQFLPFDLDNFGYSGQAGFTRANQESKFKSLNQLISGASPLPAIADLVNNWYFGGSATQISTFVPGGWTGTAAQADLYSRVVKPSCRTCHTAQPDAISWALFSDFDSFSGLIQGDICEQRIMPHAKVTFERFWLSQSPNQPAALAAFGLTNWDNTEACPTP